MMKKRKKSHLRMSRTIDSIRAFDSKLIFFGISSDFFVPSTLRHFSIRRRLDAKYEEGLSRNLIKTLFQSINLLSKLFSYDVDFTLPHLYTISHYQA